MPNKKQVKPNGWWHNKEYCRAAALECKTHSEVRCKYPVMVRTARKYGWYEEIIAHMTKRIEKVTKEECASEAKKYKTRGEFKINNPRAYDAACSKGWLGEICAHMDGRIKRKAGYWDNIEHCKETALQYSNRPELRKHEKGCHDAILKNGWQDVCFAHMNCRVREYTREQLEEIAKRYKTYQEFRDSALGAYEGAKARGILEEICKHMPPLKANPKYDCVPTFEMCAEAAKKYETRSAYKNSEDRRFYGYALKHGWLDDICKHMRVVGNQKKRCIYGAFFDEDHSVYIGLTFDTKQRWQDHRSDPKSSVNIHAKQTGFSPRFEQLTDYISHEEASKQEGVFLRKYKSEGWTILNRVKTGSLGTPEEGYSKEEVLEAASKFKSLKEFREKDGGHYEAGYRSDYWEEVRAICKPHLRIFTDEMLREIASTCHTLAELRQKDHAALDAAKKRGILDEICKHMDRSNEKTFHRFKDDEIREVASGYTSKKDFRTEHPGMYENLRRTKRIDLFCAHMENKSTKNNSNHKEEKWTEEAVRLEAAKYKHRSDFLFNSPSAYGKAIKLQILDEVCSHMQPKQRDLGYKCDNIEDAISLAKTCFDRTELKKKYTRAYKMLSKAHLLDDVIPKVPSRWNLKWTEEKRREVAKQCNSRKEFKERFPQAYDMTRQLGQLDEFCKHMPFHRHKWSIEEMTEICSHCKDLNELKEYCYELWYHAKKKNRERRELIILLCNKKDEQ